MTGLVIVLFGLLLGSFLNVCIYRLPRGLSVVHPGSSCPYCRHAISAWENIPLCSFLFLGGRCRACREPISWRYPFVEALAGAAFYWSFHRYGGSAEFLRIAFFLVAILGLISTDWDLQQLPDEITLGGLGVGLAFGAWRSWAMPTGPGITFVSALIGAVVGGGILWVLGEGYFRLRGREGMGLGDVKMMAFVGAFIGWQLTLITLALAAIVGSVVGVALAAVVFVRRVARGRRRSRGWGEAVRRSRESVAVFFAWRALPFGVFLGAMAVVSWSWGATLWHWYAARILR